VQGLEGMTATLGDFIQEEDAVMDQRHFGRHRHVAAADQPDILDGVVRRAIWARGDQRRPVSSDASDVVDAAGLMCFG
jgi:hypothetical protein